LEDWLLIEELVAMDIAIVGGYIVDGSGQARYQADLMTRGDRIAEIGSLQGATARRTIDASGQVVVPGFVDMHSHLDQNLPLLPTADSLIQQGITTAVVGQCGSSLVPLLDGTREQVLAAVAKDEHPLPWDEFSTFRSYFDYMAGIGFSINIVPLVGQATVRAAVMGFTSAPLGASDMKRAQAEVLKAMDSGAIGISTGLIYPPGSFAQTDELIDLIRPIGQRDGFYFSHVRGEDHKLLAAIGEAIQIGRETGAAVQISHLKAAGRRNWGLAVAALDLLDQARAEGLDIAADMYPYRAGSAGLASILPEWAQEGGKTATIARLADPHLRPAIIESAEEGGFFSFASWDDILVGSSPRNRDYEGHFVAELAAAAAKPAYDWVFDALVETEMDIAMIIFQVSDDNLRLQLQHPAVMIGTDAEGGSVNSALSAGLPHPRNFGTYPRVLARFVREENLLTLEEAIWKMTGLPAQRLRWSDRGILKVGCKADIVVLDPDIVSDVATYHDPKQYPRGISQVIVNGELVVDGGTHTQARPGKVLGR
jgi:N-acyl-D-amino-acid deacylase